MECWNILGIAATDDKGLIKQSYMEKLNYFHPEENPEGFQKLRQAYELALKEADKLNSEKEIDNSPLGLWMQKVENIYNKFSLRINIQNWEELLQDDVCFQIDSTREASYKLLTFLMDNYRLPQNVWKVLEDRFNWREEREELYKNFPVQFIDFIINEILYEDTIRYDLFKSEEDGNYDTWFNLYYALKDAIKENEKENAEKFLNDVKELKIEQPDMTILEIRYLLQINEIDKAREIGEKLLKTLPEYPSLLYAMGNVEFNAKNIEISKQYYQKTVELDESYIGAKIGVADCLFESGDFEEALDIYENVCSIYPYNNYIRQCIYKSNLGLIGYYTNIINQNLEDSETLFKLAWAYFDTNKYKECKEIANNIKLEEKSEKYYYNLLGKVNSELNDHEKALEYFDKWLGICDNNDDKGYIYILEAKQFEAMQDYNKALEYYDKALEFSPDSTDCLCSKSTVLNKLKKYEEALEVCDKAIAINNNIAHLYLNKAKSLYHLDEYKEAMRNCEICNDIYAYIVESYLIQVKIYYDVRDYEQGLDVIQNIKELEIENNEVKLYEAKILEALSQVDEARKIYLELIKEEPENHTFYYDFAYFNKDNENYDDALCYINKSIALKDEIYKYYLRGIIYRKTKKYDEAFKDFDYIIKSGKDINIEYAYYNKGLLYFETDDYEMALIYYNKVIEINPEHSAVNNAIGEIYEKKKLYDKALEFYNKQIEIEDDDYYYINRGWCYISLNRYEEAKNDFETIIETNDKNIYAYNGLGNVYKYEENYEDAIEYFKKILEIDDTYKYAYRDIGECYEELDKLDKSEEYYTQAIIKFPDDETFYLDRGLIYAQQDKYDEALKDYEKSVKINPSYSYAYNNMGVVYRDLKQYDKAINFYKKAIEVNSSYPKPYKNIGYIYMYKLKNYPKAVKYFTKYININPNDPDIYNERGEAYFKLGNTTKSQKDFEIALKYYLEDLKEKENYACIYKEIGFCYEHLEQFDNAKKYYNRAIELSPNCKNCKKKQCHDSYFRLGKMSEQQGKNKEALEYYMKANQISPDEEYQEAIDNINEINKKQSYSKNKPNVKKLIKKIFSSK